MTWLPALVLPLVFLDSSAAAAPVNCQQIYEGPWLERTSDMIVEGSAVFDDDPRIRVTRTLKGKRASVVKISTQGPGEDEIWICPDYWQPSRRVERGRFYLLALDEKAFRIMYFVEQ